MKNLYPLLPKLDGEEGHPGYVLCRTTHAGHQAGLHRIAPGRENNRNFGSHRLRGQRRSSAAEGNKDVDIAIDKLGSQHWQLLELIPRPAILNCNVFTFYKSDFVQSLLETRNDMRAWIRRGTVQNADRRQRLLCTYRKRPCRRAAEQRDELAPSHAGHGGFLPQRITASSACHRPGW